MTGQSVLWITVLVCFSVLDTAILVPWAISRKRRAQNARNKAVKTAGDETKTTNQKK